MEYIVLGLVVIFVSTIVYSAFMLNRMCFSLPQKIAILIILILVGCVGASIVSMGFKDVGMTKAWPVSLIVVVDTFLGIFSYLTLASLYKAGYNKGYIDGGQNEINKKVLDSYENVNTIT